MQNCSFFHCCSLPSSPLRIHFQLHTISPCSSSVVSPPQLLLRPRTPSFQNNHPPKHTGKQLRQTRTTAYYETCSGQNAFPRAPVPYHLCCLAVWRWIISSREQRGRHPRAWWLCKQNTKLLRSFTTFVGGRKLQQERRPQNWSGNSNSVCRPGDLHRQSRAGTETSGGETGQPRRHRCFPLLQARNQEIEDPAPRTENRTNLSKQRARTICFLRFPRDAPTRRAKEERPARGKAATSPEALAPAGAPASAGGRCRASAAARGPGATSENTVGFATFFTAVKEHIPVRAR